MLLLQILHQGDEEKARLRQHGLPLTQIRASPLTAPTPARDPAGLPLRSAWWQRLSACQPLCHWCPRLLVPRVGHTSLPLPRPRGQRSVPSLPESSPWGGVGGVSQQSPQCQAWAWGCPRHRASSVLPPRLSQRATRLGAVFALLEQRVTAGRASVASSRRGRESGAQPPSTRPGDGVQEPPPPPTHTPRP